MDLRVYNTLTRQTEAFETIEPGKVTMYCCGPTVYDLLGVHNARTFVVFDVIRRYLQFRGYDVTFAQNVTDIEDKIIRRAKENDADPAAWARDYAEYYFEDMRDLGVHPPDITPYATETISEMQELIARLIDVGAAYETDSGVYYRIGSFPEYGRLSNRTADDIRSGARVEVDDEKEDPRDFALWKRAKPDEPSWESQWGPGRPGWHIECSSMVMKHLGETIDIHAGGADLMFPHHENEIAQSERATGKPFARYWLHGGLLRRGGERMGKSVGNFVTVRDALKTYPRAAIRLFLLSAHYRKPLEYSDSAIPNQIGPAERLNRCIDDLAEAAGDAVPVFDLADIADDAVATELFKELGRARERFTAAGDEDFNFPGAFGALFELVRAANRCLSHDAEPSRWKQSVAASTRDFLVETVGGVFGLLADDGPVDDGRVARALDVVVEWRSRARDAKMWDIADRMRDQLDALGIALNDAHSGTAWELRAGRSITDAAAGAIDLLIELRIDARSEEDGDRADALRDALGRAGVMVEDSRNGTEWRWADGPSTAER